MNILFITTTYPTPTRPRQGMFNRNLVGALRDNHDVRVIAPIPWTELNRDPWSNTKSIAAETGDMHPRYFYPPKVLRSQYDSFYWRSILSSIKHCERSFQPDLVLGYWLHPDGAAAQRAADHFRVPCVVFSGGSDLRRLPRDPRRRCAIERVLTQADRLIVVSHDLSSVAIELGTDPNKIDVIYRGVDRTQFHQRNRADARDRCGLAKNGIVLLWSGRFELVKNPLMLIHAAAHWKKRWGDRLQVLVAGDGSMRGEMRKLRRQLGLENCVRFEGSLDQNNLAVRYSAADVMVLTSHSEGIPNVLLESIASGVPFVATDVGGVSEIATLGLDRLVEDNDLDALVDAVIQQVENPSVADRQFVPDSLSEMSDRFEDVFRKALSNESHERCRMNEAS